MASPRSEPQDSAQAQASSGGAPRSAQQRAETGRRLKAGVGTLSTATLHRLDARLPWYRAMTPADRSWVGLVAQSGITSFVDWYRSPSQPIRVVGEIFRAAPRELMRSISLTQTLQLLRVVVEVVEERVPDLSKKGDQAALREAVLLFSREAAFAAADVYARAAEARGNWDARLEAMIIDALVRGDSVDDLMTRSAALGWRSDGDVVTMVGQAPLRQSANPTEKIRTQARKFAEDVLVGIHSERLLLVLGGCEDITHAGEVLADSFGPAPVVIGPRVPSLAEASSSVAAANAARRAVVAWPDAPRPVQAAQLWPEATLAGNRESRDNLLRYVYQPLVNAGGSLLDTVSHYLDCGGSLEATAKAMLVHPNTVRYRLRKVADLIEIDPMAPRASFVLWTALVYGRLSEANLLSQIDKSPSNGW